MDDSRLSVGDLLEGGKYRIGKTLAAGGFAIIYSAQRDDGEPVAIKVLRRTAQQQDEAVISRFNREAHLAIQLHHPNNVRVLGVGLTDDGHLYIAMELLSGKTLEKAFASGDTFPPERVHTILLQLLGALNEIHGLGVVHRDVKPANIFLVDRPGGMDFVKLLDYGFAKLLDDHALGNRVTLQLTQRGVMLGTPGYLAPEVCDGDAVTPRTNLYALGIISHELLAGRPAYTGGPMEKTQQQLRGNPAALPRSLRSLALSKVVTRLLERKPSKRYGSAAEAIEALEAIEHPAFTASKKGWFGLW